MILYRIVEQYDELIVQKTCVRSTEHNLPKVESEQDWEYMCSVRFGNKTKQGRVEDTWNKARAIVHALNEHEKIGVRHG